VLDDLEELAYDVESLDADGVLLVASGEDGEEQLLLAAEVVQQPGLRQLADVPRMPLRSTTSRATRRISSRLARPFAYEPRRAMTLRLSGREPRSPPPAKT
jgi:hypothetical protein